MTTQGVVAAAIGPAVTAYPVDDPVAVRMTGAAARASLGS
jgi:hypothetical protein